VILASHSRITIPPETWFLLPLLRRLRTDQPLDVAQVEFAVKTITGHYRWPDMMMSEADFRRRVRELERPFLRDIVQIIYQTHMERDHKPRWGDKTPGYIEVVPQLMELFPGARFIHLVRDGRDVAKSFQQRGWYGPWLHENTREWNEALAYRERWNHVEAKNSILDVRYEDLVLDTERTVRGICDFLGEQFEPQMLAWQGRVEDLVPARELVIHDKLGRPPAAADVERWRHEMTVRELFVSEAFLGRHLVFAGYEPYFINPLWTPLFQLTRWSCVGMEKVTSFPLKTLRHLRESHVRQSSGAPRE